MDEAERLTTGVFVGDAVDTRVDETLDVLRSLFGDELLEAAERVGAEFADKLFRRVVEILHARRENGEHIRPLLYGRRVRGRGDGREDEERDERLHCEHFDDNRERAAARLRSARRRVKVARRRSAARLKRGAPHRAISVCTRARGTLT